MKVGLPLMKTILKLLAKSVLLALGLKTAASAVHTGIHKKTLFSGTSTLIILRKMEIWNMVKIS